jgi:methylated-DNA-[protein]-cysteine S-methyltransferase
MLTASPLGDILLRAEEDALTGAFFVGQKYFPHDDGASAAAIDTIATTSSRVLHDAAEQLREYFAGERQHFTVRLQLAGTPFQRSVWNALVQIPYGEVASYGALAHRLGCAAGSARAVGAANGRNPVSIIVPCHRVISSAGELTGYAGGLPRKHALLALEKRSPTLPQHQLELLDGVGF